MLPAGAAEPFDSPSYSFDVIWDGVRALLFIERGHVRVQDRFCRDITARYPELHPVASHVNGSGVILDGAIVCLDGDGRPDFDSLHRRLLVADDLQSSLLATEAPVTFEAFDILYRGGLSVMRDPLHHRKVLLHGAVRTRGVLDVPDSVDREGIAFFEAARAHGLPGIIAKHRDSRYSPGAADGSWIAMRVYQRDKFVIAGYTFGRALRPGRPPRSGAPFDSLLLAQHDSAGALRLAGEVEGPFSEHALSGMISALDALASPQSPLSGEAPCGRLVFWCRPELVASVRFAGRAAGGLRFPLFEYLRPDVPPSACTLPGDGAG
jgi:bifunctional non-homologous end joining protein LigD